MVGVRSEPELSLKLGPSHDNSPRDEITKKMMTIFFNGEVRVLDVTETQVCVLVSSSKILICFVTMYELCYD
jgi:tify domain